MGVATYLKTCEMFSPYFPAISIFKSQLNPSQATPKESLKDLFTGSIHKGLQCQQQSANISGSGESLSS